MMSLLSWIVTGLIVGLLARAIVPGRQQIGVLLTMALGVAGAAFGGFVSTLIWPTWTDDPNVSQMWPGWIMATLGAVALLWGYLAMTTRRGLPSRV